MDGQVWARARDEVYPDFQAELDEVRRDGPSPTWVRRVIEKHRPRAAYDRALYERYRGTAVPIFARHARFESAGADINNRLNNDFFGEIVDFKTGFFAGRAIGYSYADTPESAAGPGGKETVSAAQKAMTDFTMRNNQYDLDLECTKLAACCGYAARLFYIGPDGLERAMPVLPFEAAILSDTSVGQPAAAVRYFQREVDGETQWRAEVYDKTWITAFAGKTLDGLAPEGPPRAHLFDGCPLQGIENNSEMTSDGEKQLGLMDAYDRALSDANNESESFAAAYMVYENVNIDDEQMKMGQRSGAIRFYNGAGAPGRIYFVTKDVNDNFIEHHLNRLEENIYRFSKTPNLHDEHFAGNASGVAMKYKMAGLETKCGIWQAKLMSAGMYMFELLCGCWHKKGLLADPLQCVMDFHRNFPLDVAGEAAAVKTLVEAGVPQKAAFSQLSFVDDVDYLVQMAEEETKKETEKTEKIVEEVQNQAETAGGDEKYSKDKKAYFTSNKK